MKKPSAIHLFGFRIKVIWSRHRPSWVPAGAAHGCYDPAGPKRIWIDTSTPPYAQRTNLAHELNHLLRDVSGTDIKDEAADETVVWKQEPVLNELLLRNPDWLKMYLEDDKGT